MPASCVHPRLSATGPSDDTASGRFAGELGYRRFLPRHDPRRNRRHPVKPAGYLARWAAVRGVRRPKPSPPRWPGSTRGGLHKASAIIGPASTRSLRSPTSWAIATPQPARLPDTLITLLTRRCG